MSDDDVERAADREIDIYEREAAGLRARIMGQSAVVAGMGCANKVLRAERDGLRAELDAVRKLATEVPPDVTKEELADVFATWKSAALKASDAWAAQDGLIKTLTDSAGQAQALFDHVVAQRDEARAEVERLHTTFAMNCAECGRIRAQHPLSYRDCSGFKESESYR